MHVPFILTLGAVYVILYSQRVSAQHHKVESVFMSEVLILLFINNKVLLSESAGATSPSLNIAVWLVGVFFTALITGLIGLLFWFMRDKFNSLEKTDNRIEKSVKKFNRWAVSIDGRVNRIEGYLGTAPFTSQSPLRLTEIGKEILKQSGIGEMANQFKDQLLQKIREENPETAYDVQEITREVFRDFDFGSDNVRNLKEYAFQNGKWQLFDILDVGSIYFYRNIALKEFGLNIEDLDNKLDYAVLSSCPKTPVSPIVAERKYQDKFVAISIGPERKVIAFGENYISVVREAEKIATNAFSIISVPKKDLLL